MTQEEQARRSEQLKAVVGLWERNIGPLDNTPAVRQLLLELLTGKGNSEAMQSGLGDALDAASSAEGQGFGQWAEETFRGMDFKLSDLGMYGLDLGGRFDLPDAPPVPSGSLGGFGSWGGDSWLSVVLLGLFAAAALVLWWVWPKLGGGADGRPRPLTGLGPWPVDPRAIADRDALVKAFEYLSVRVCGAGARVWNHATIAGELRRLRPKADVDADALARLYAVARYAPAAEPLPAGTFAEARRHLCRLAGVPAP